jgi:Fe-S cluster assembly protein SufB
MTTVDPNVRNTVGEYKWGFHDTEKPLFMAEKGLSEGLVREISAMKEEPEWMLEYRLEALETFYRLENPKWAGSPDVLDAIDFDNIHYYVKATDTDSTNWEDVPEYIKDTFDKLGIPEAERQFLAGAGAQYDSEVVYHNIREDLEAQGVQFLGMDQGLREHEDLVREHFSTIIPSGDNKYAALNTAVWSGGSFIYVPPGVHVEVPLQAYFRINTENMGQFERTLIIADEGSYIHYVEGCTAPTYSSDSLHSAVVEIIVKKNARVRYTTIQNWSNNVYNLVTKRAYAYENAVMEWVDGNIGSKLTMKYPSVYLMEPGAHQQHQDAGGKIVHVAPDTTSAIVSKSVSRGSGRSSYRGLLKVHEGATNSSSTVRCDALLLDELSRSDTYPTMEVDEERVNIGHEASVSRLGEDQLFYLMSRGIDEESAAKMVVNGFVEPIVKELPMEYAIELNRLIELQMEGSVG